MDSTVATTGSATAGVGTASVIATTTAGGNGVVIVVGGTSTAVGRFFLLYWVWAEGMWFLRRGHESQSVGWYLLGVK